MEILNIFFYWKIEIFLKCIAFYLLSLCGFLKTCVHVLWACMYVHMCVRVHISVIVDQWRSEDTMQQSVLSLQPIGTQDLNQVIKLDIKTLTH